MINSSLPIDQSMTNESLTDLLAILIQSTDQETKFYQSLDNLLKSNQTTQLQNCLESLLRSKENFPPRLALLSSLLLPLLRMIPQV